MKHVVTLTTSNPAHEHVSLRRRQSTTNFMVEAADEQTAILRATAHFRRLGHYIHEAKIFKKKEQLNELAPLALIPAALGAAGRIALPYAARYLAGQAARQGILQGGRTTLGKLTRDEVLAQGAGLGASELINKLMPGEGDKETSLGSVVSSGAGSILGGRLGFVGKVAGATAAKTAAVKDAADDIAQAAIQKAAAATKSVGDTANDVVAAALQKARALVPGKIEVPAQRPDVELEPAVAPQRVVPTVKPEVKVDTATPEAQAQAKPDTVVGRADPMASPKAEPQAKAEPKAMPKGETKPKTTTKTVPPKKPIRPFMPFSGGGDGPDVDPGTLGQYRGLFPLYRFADFNSLQETAAMNAVGRVLAKRKKIDKDNAEGEKNKINMEPKLGGKA